MRTPSRNHRVPIGTKLRVYCPSKGVYHYGIASYGNTVIDRAPRFGVARRSWWDFSEGQTVEIVPREQGDFSLEETHRRAERSIGNPEYSVYDANCEHFVNICSRGEATSGQVQIAGAVGGLAVLALILSSFFGGEGDQKER